MDTLRRTRPRRVGRSAPLQWKVTDELWAKLEPLLADPARRFRYPGRARYSPRACLEGILYVLYTDTPWLELPYRELGLPSGETCRRRLEEWSRRGLLPAALALLAEELAEAGRLDWSRVLVDASLVEAKKGAARSRARSRASRQAVFTSPSPAPGCRSPSACRARTRTSAGTCSPSSMR
ncbi:MAG: transposase [Actinomycetota bacterium]|nr:transposase [Actinomycetota bacterium]